MSTVPQVSTVALRAFDEALSTLHQCSLEDPAAPPPLLLRAFAAQGPGEVSRPLELRSRPGRPPPPAERTTPPEPSSPAGVGSVTARDAIGSGTAATELVVASLAALQATVGLGALVAVDERAALREAAAMDSERAAGHLRGPLHGVPITVKDILNVAGLPTAAGSIAYLDHPKVDADAVAILRSAGAIVLGKAATHEFALGVTCPSCANPHDPARLAGGSSGGSAVAVATGVGLASLGTDTRASLRVPAALCGVVGFKPSFGRVPTRGVVPLSWTMDHVGPIARTVEDAALVLGVLCGDHQLSARLNGSARGVVIGVPDEVLGDADAAVAEVTEAALTTLERLGARIVSVERPRLADLRRANALGLLISRAEAATFHRSLGTDIARCMPEVRDQLSAGLAVPAADYLDAQKQRQILSEQVLTSFEQCDAVVTPTCPIVAPLREDYEQCLLRLSLNTILWSLIGNPALSMPSGTVDGLPVAIQFAGPRHTEARLANIGVALERALGPIR